MPSRNSATRSLRRNGAIAHGRSPQARSADSHSVDQRVAIEPAAEQQQPGRVLALEQDPRPCRVRAGPSRSRRRGARAVPDAIAAWRIRDRDRSRCDHARRRRRGPPPARGRAPARNGRRRSVRRSTAVGDRRLRRPRSAGVGEKHRFEEQHVGIRVARRGLLCRTQTSASAKRSRRSRSNAPHGPRRAARPGEGPRRPSRRMSDATRSLALADRIDPCVAEGELRRRGRRRGAGGGDRPHDGALAVPPCAGNRKSHACAGDENRRKGRATSRHGQGTGSRRAPANARCARSPPASSRAQNT